jgi:chemosensory pili system protein ChpA (sensor histidine kinase/response regulator)
MTRLRTDVLNRGTQYGMKGYRMNQVIDFSTLTWVKNELDQTLREARQSLEAHVETPEDEAQLELLAGHLHQVYGTLRMVELYGASLLAEEMEHAARAIADNSVSQHDDACEVLMRAILQLPDYLERLIAGQRDIPLVLLPILNDLRAVRGENLLSENSMFSPNLNAPLPETLVRGEAAGDLKSQARELRPRFQRGLLGWFRGHDADSCLNAVSGVLGNLQELSGTAEGARLWWIAAGVTDAITENSIDASVAVKRLIGQLDRQIRRVIEHGESALIQAPPVDLLKNLLFYVAQSRSTGPRIAEIQTTYQLGDLLPREDELASARESLAGRNADLFATVAVAIKEELGRLKDSLDLVLRSGGENREKLQPLIDSLRSLGDTLGMLSLDAPRRAVISKAEDLAAYVEAGQSPAETSLMDVASTLLFVESSVDNMGRGRVAGAPVGQPDEELAKSEYTQVMDVVLHEAIADLVRAKEAIIAYTESSHDTDAISDVPQWFRQVKGGLTLLGEGRAAALTGAAARYVENELIKNKKHPPEHELDSLADCICGLEYYLESRKEHAMYGGSAFGVAADSIERLGYPVDDTDESTQIADEEAWQAESGAVAVESQQDAADLDAESLAEQSDASELPEVVSADEDAAETGERSGSNSSDACADMADFQTQANEYADQQARTETGESNEVVAVAGAQDSVCPDQHDVDAAEPETFPSAVDAVEIASEHRAEQEENRLAIVGEDVDEEILQIFIEEAEEEITSINEQLPAWLQDSSKADALATVRRSFHTLKGSGRLIGAMRIGEFAWTYENMLNRLIDGSISLSPELVELLQAARRALPELVTEIKHGSRVYQPVSRLMQSAEALSKGQPVPAVPQSSGDLSEPTDLEPLDEQQLGADAVQDLSAEVQQQDQMPAEREAGHEASVSGGMDPMLHEIFNTEAQGYLEVIRHFLVRADSGDSHPDETLARALHTLHGSAHMAQADPIADLSGELEKYVKALMSCGQSMSEAGRVALRDSSALIDELLGQLPDELSVPDRYAGTLQSVWSIRESVPVADDTASLYEMESLAPTAEPFRVGEIAAPETGFEDLPSAVPLTEAATIEPDPYAECDAELLEIFLEESEQNLETSDAALRRWRHSADDADALAELQRALHTLKGGARMAGLMPVGDLAHSVESLVISIAENRSKPGAEAFDGAQKGQDRLVCMLEDVRAHKPLTVEPELIAELDELRHEVLNEVRGSGEGDAVTTTAPPEPVAQEAAHSASNPYADTDAELLDVFLEEAGDILEHNEETLRAWRQQPDKKDLIAELQRELHTLKGGARMADITAIGDLAHAVESLMVKVADGEVVANESMFLVLDQVHDRLAGMVEQVRHRRSVVEAQDLLGQLERLLEGRSLPAEEDANAATVQEAQAALAEEVAVHDDNEHIERRAKSRTSQELVRVKANLLDNMVNYAGEVSIYRSRLEQQVGAYRFNLVEMEQTVTRLREQLRKLEIETEAQIIFRYETEAVNENEDFDPLEMDRYSHMQQLSRSLMESVGDLASIQNLLENITRESETLLLQQSRVNTELQEGLMRTRMVPFLGLAARMRRIVRQTCRELGKKAELELSGAEGEMDRTVVDRIIAPLEHMLRNAISHGIESPQQRLAAGKPEAGTISITLERESADVLLKIADDGRGINLDAIRNKAIERGLMAADADLSDSEVLQFILETGFSTAEHVTQVAGRGVGMDVVNSEVKQLGGSLLIDSEWGRGTTFTVRLPFTLALNQALLVEVGEDTYAVPLSSIQGIVRIRREDLKRHYENPEARFDYAGTAYEVRHLGSMLGAGKPRLDSGATRMPVLLARTGERYVAFQVENLMGSREIVVKSVGPQISSVRGITGATILGDGRVVMILDIAALLRAGASSTMAQVGEMLHQPRRTQGLTVMVVDDSITVRKVTARLLERNEMNVIAAKDGVDAVSKLQERIPDIMLLDIEMPRMDGFELATHVRNEPRLRHIPIIMITSRTGDKHRQRAMQIGVNRYLGKPFQETDLLENIQALLEASGTDSD